MHFWKARSHGTGHSLEFDHDLTTSQTFEPQAKRPEIRFIVGIMKLSYSWPIKLFCWLLDVFSNVRKALCSLSELINGQFAQAYININQAF